MVTIALSVLSLAYICARYAKATVLQHLSTAAETEDKIHETVTTSLIQAKKEDGIIRCDFIEDK